MITTSGENGEFSFNGSGCDTEMVKGFLFIEDEVIRNYRYFLNCAICAKPQSVNIVIDASGGEYAGLPFYPECLKYIAEAAILHREEQTK